MDGWAWRCLAPAEIIVAAGGCEIGRYSYESDTSLVAYLLENGSVSRAKRRM